MGAGASSAGGGGEVWAARLGECCAKHVTATEREAVWSGADGDGPSSAVSRQAVASGVLSWTLRVSGEPRIILGAAPAEFGSGATAGLACAPPVPGWAVGHGVSDSSGKGEMTRVTCKEGDRFAVAADLTNGRLTIHQAPEHGTSSGRWRKVLDTPTLAGAVRLCVCCFGGPATVELLDLREEIRCQVIRPIGAEGLDRRGPAGSCRLFLGPGFRLGARWNRLVETVKTRKKRGKMGQKWARYGLKGVKESGSPGGW